MFRSNPGTTLGMGILTLGAGYYYYSMRTGGEDTKTMARRMKDDAAKARGAIPRGSKAEKAGERSGLEGGVEEAVSNPRASGKPDERIPEYVQDGKSTLSHELREMKTDAASRVNEGVDRADRTVEGKAREARGAVAGLFGSK